MTLNSQGRNENRLNDEREYERYVQRLAPSIIDDKRTPLISRHVEDDNSYSSLMGFGKSTVKQTVFNAVV